MQDKPAEWYDALDTLVQNGMFRNREHDGKPISGSDADCSLDESNQEISDICDWIEEQQIMQKIMPGYVNDPVDVDKEGCFV